MREALL